MNNLYGTATVAQEKPIGTLDRVHHRMATAIHVLFVGPLDRGSMVHDALLDGPGFHLTIAAGYRELWAIPSQEPLHAVILHSTLSSFELEAACQLIRRRWPHARILVVRNGDGFLEDALYDDRVAPTVAPEALITTIERLTKRWHEWRSGDVEL
jgi:hypothetical protein